MTDHVPQRFLARRGPNSDDFIPVKGGSEFGGHSRGGSLGDKEESVFDPEEALLAKVCLRMSVLSCGIDAP